MVFLAERGIDVSPRTVLRWVQTFGPLLAAEVRQHRRRPGTHLVRRRGVLLSGRGEEKRYSYRAIDEHGQVLDVLFRDHRDTASAEAFFRRTLGAAGAAPTTVVSDHHQPYIAAVQEVFPRPAHPHGAAPGARRDTKPIERSHVPTRDRLRSSRGLKTLATGQRFFEGFEALHALHRGHVHLEHLVPGVPPAGATPHQRARALADARRAQDAREALIEEWGHAGDPAGSLARLVAPDGEFNRSKFADPQIAEQFLLDGFAELLEPRGARRQQALRINERQTGGRALVPLLEVAYVTAVYRSVRDHIPHCGRGPAELGAHAGAAPGRRLRGGHGHRRARRCEAGRPAARRSGRRGGARPRRSGRYAGARGRAAGRLLGSPCRGGGGRPGRPGGGAPPYGSAPAPPVTIGQVVAVLRRAVQPQPHIGALPHRRRDGHRARHPRQIGSREQGCDGRDVPAAILPAQPDAAGDRSEVVLQGHGHLPAYGTADGDRLPKNHDVRWTAGDGQDVADQEPAVHRVAQAA